MATSVDGRYVLFWMKSTELLAQKARYDPFDLWRAVRQVLRSYFGLAKPGGLIPVESLCRERSESC